MSDLASLSGLEKFSADKFDEGSGAVEVSLIALGRTLLVSEVIPGCSSSTAGFSWDCGCWFMFWFSSKVVACWHQVRKKIACEDKVSWHPR